VRTAIAGPKRLQVSQAHLACAFFKLKGEKEGREGDSHIRRAAAIEKTVAVIHRSRQFAS